MSESKYVQRTTIQIISLGNNILEEYDRQCKKGWFDSVPNWLSWLSSSPGDEGLKRREAFSETLKSIQSEDSPELAFIKLFRFYETHISHSRLMILLGRNLPLALGIKVPKLIMGPHSGNALEVMAAHDLFMKIAKSIKHECGIESDKDIPLSIMKSSAS